MKLNKCKRGNRAYDLAKQLRDQAEGVEYTLITELYARERDLLMELLRRFDGIYRERKHAARRAGFCRSGRVHRTPAGESPRNQRAPAAASSTTS